VPLITTSKVGPTYLVCHLFFYFFIFYLAAEGFSSRIKTEEGAKGKGFLRGSKQRRERRET
jgi:hypothetical protein